MIFSTTHAGISAKQQKDLVKQLASYKQHLADVRTHGGFEALESSINLPFSKHIDQILAKANAYRTKSLRTVVVIGIGGSNLGTQAVYEALPKKDIELLFLDTVSSTHFLNIIEKLTKSLKNKKQFLIVSISKSGGTTETIANTEAFLSALKKPYGDVRDRLVIITDEGSKFHDLTIQQKIDSLTIPKMVGGRFSVFSAVGLFPLAVAGYDIRALCRGAKSAVDASLSSAPSENAAMTLAVATHLQQKNGCNILNSFFFAPELESLGKWERQLIGESLGKEFDRDGKRVNAGLTPIVSIGSTDLHSMAQLYFGGPRNTFTTIVSVKDTRRVLVPQKQLFPTLVENLAGKSLATIMDAVVNGVKATYQKSKLPFVECVFEKLDEASLGAFLQTRMIQIMYLGELMHVNAFDQPNVEMYKVETKKGLS